MTYICLLYDTLSLRILQNAFLTTSVTLFITTPRQIAAWHPVRYYF